MLDEIENSPFFALTLTCLFMPWPISSKPSKTRATPSAASSSSPPHLYPLDLATPFTRSSMLISPKQDALYPRIERDRIWRWVRCSHPPRIGAQRPRSRMTTERSPPLTDHAGGTLAGISSGQPLLLRVAFKPPSSIKKRNPLSPLRPNSTTLDPSPLPATTPASPSAPSPRRGHGRPYPLLTPSS